MTEDQPTSDGALSFERAEFAADSPQGLACAFCQQPLSQRYWQVGKRPACAECRARLELAIAHSMSSGNFARALSYGLLAALAGSVAWVVIERLTGAQVGIVALGIGYAVGKAVRRGAAGFGGPRYQALAVFLTYSSIALASLPAYLELAKAASQSSFTTTWPTVLALSYASPFLDLKDHVIGLVILGIGLYQAWKLTRALPVIVLGPFAMEASAPAALELAALELAPTPDAST